MQESKRTEQLHTAYARQRDQEESYRRSLELIYEVFSSKRREAASAGNALYDAMARICRQMDMPIAAYETMESSCGTQFSVTDVALLSHFTVWAVQLDEKWYRQDAGPFLAFDRESGEPIACIPKGPCKYMAYRSGVGTPIPVDAAVAAGITGEAWVLCRPFPHRPMNWWDLLEFGRHNVYKSDIIHAVVLTLLGTLVGLLLPWLNERVYDDLIPLGNASQLYEIGGVVLACALGNVCFLIVRNLAQMRSMSTMKIAVQAATYDRLFHLPDSMLSRYDAADLAQRAQGITEIYQTITDSFLSSALSAVFSLLYLWRMFRYSPSMGLVATLMTLVAVLYMAWQGRRQTHLEKKILHERVQARTTMYQLLSGITEIRSAGVEDRALYQYMQPYAGSEKMDALAKRYQRYVDTVLEIYPLVFAIVLYYMMVRGDINMTIGSFVGFNTAFGAFSAAILTFVNAAIQTDDIIPIYEHCLPILQAVPEYHADAVVPESLTGDIELDHVSFAYDEEAGDVLREVSLHIEPGEYVGIVGSSGSGKSTLLRLLLGFERPRIGNIYYDGQDVEHLDKRALRVQCGVVLQGGVLNNGTILDNLTIGAPDAGPDRVQEVVDKVGLTETIAQLPLGVDTNLSENARMISGGQQQQILLARALVGQPRILFLDEATSSIDNVTQAQITEYLRELPITRVVIAHRISTVTRCDRILVMEEGQIVEEGTYEALMARKGRFYELAERQIS